MLNIKKIREVGFSLSLIWNFFVLLIIIPNLVLILFDLSYLILRPSYKMYVPILTELYDPVLGIESHRTTDDYLKLISNLKKIEGYREKEEARKSLIFYLGEYREVSGTNLKEELRSQFETIHGSIEKDTELSPENMGKLKSILEESRQFLKIEMDLEKYSELNKIQDNINSLIRCLSPEGMDLEKLEILSKMDLQMVRIIEENPFYESGQTYVFKSIQRKIKEFYNKNAKPTDDENLRNLLTVEKGRRIPSTAIAFSYFWRNEKIGFSEKIRLFDEQFRDEFNLNYFRTTDLTGRPTNNFFKIDLPFYIFFLLEFMINWYISIRDRKYHAPFLYPLYHWYDIFGLIPLQGFHFFRLFRIYKIYEILKESEFTTIGDDIISRTIRYYSNIMKEEISDMVTIQILSETQEEVRSGSSITVLTNAINSHRPEIKQIILDRFTNPRSTETLQRTVDELVQLFLGEFSSNLKKIFPFSELPGMIFQFSGETMSSFAKTERGKRIIEKTTDLILDEIIVAAESEEVNRLNAAITVDLLENVKKQVAVKKWVGTEL